MRTAEKIYWKFVEEVAGMIAYEMNEASQEDIPLDGRKFCKDRGIEETTFSDAVDFKLENVSYGVSPMLPFFTGKNLEARAKRELTND